MVVTLPFLHISHAKALYESMGFPPRAAKDAANTFSQFSSK